ncbi:MAG: enoyl-CoA hydratase-related protein [Oleiphilaceae bacterium]|nr:enoyl-CoA hydratase-related protein [Oleiphilaceae bacterium]
MSPLPATRCEFESGVATLTLNRPDKHNAFDDSVIAELLAHLNTLAKREDLRVLVLKAEGKHFCAGADLAWMKRMVDLSYDDNQADAKQLATLMQTLEDFPAPTVCRVQGAAYGGAIGLIACCDIAIASNDARFCLSEVKLGLAPATIGPFVVKAMGARICQRLFITAEVFKATLAQQYGLVHECVPRDELDSAIERTVSHIISTGPQASRAAKALVKTVSVPGDHMAYTSDLIARLRVSEEGQEGLSAFFDKRSPNWVTNTH